MVHNQEEIAKHEVARGAGGESVMSNNGEHQKGEHNLLEEKLGEVDQSKGEKKHVVTSNPEEREKERTKGME
ncbi:hypothetical protein VNO77_42267 [Canavalia gladiata]|uniref:Uncharacterized protein n=1 Tax=Canavalia gladiata TaxID=3824 RepID=A0AAN9K2Z4_CANGL